jgi:hypothetical protein
MIGGFAAYVIVRAVVRSPDTSVIIRFGVPTLVVAALILLIKMLWNRLRRQAGSKNYGAAIVAEEPGEENHPPRLP